MRRCRIRMATTTVSISFNVDDRREFFAILDDLKASAIVAFASGRREWTADRGAEQAIRAWAHRNFTPDEIQWHWPEQDRGPWRQRSSDQQRATPPPDTLQTAYASLHLLPSAPEELVSAAYRDLAKRSHPDAGGSHAAMVTINDAYARIRGARA